MVNPYRLIQSCLVLFWSSPLWGVVGYALWQWSLWTERNGDLIPHNGAWPVTGFVITALVGGAASLLGLVKIFRLMGHLWDVLNIRANKYNRARDNRKKAIQTFKELERPSLF